MGSPDGARAFGQEDASLAGAATDGERFGSALAARDFNGNGVTDLAVGVPFDDPNGETDAGAVNVIYGQSGNGVPGEDFTNGRADQGLVNVVLGRDGGLTTGTPAGVLTQDLLGEDAESGDEFGSALY